MLRRSILRSSVVLMDREPPRIPPRMPDRCPAGRFAIVPKALRRLYPVAFKRSCPVASFFLTPGLYVLLSAVDPALPLLCSLSRIAGYARNRFVSVIR